MEKINGYELALKVLRHPQGGVEALLRLSGNDESSWLELKAGMRLLPEDKQRGYQDQDLYWNIAHAVIELMNASGGILLIGIDDKTHEVVPLRNNDPLHLLEKEGPEAYRRKEILERVWPRALKWNTPKSGKWSIPDGVPPGLVEVMGCRYRDEEIAAVLVHPAPNCIHVWKNDEVEQIPIREPGEIGKEHGIKGSRQMAEYEARREVATEYLTGLYEKFLADAKATSAIAELDHKIAEYYADFENRLKAMRQFDLSCFTPLDAAEDDDFMSPQAIEEYEEYVDPDHWLDDDNESDADEENEEERDAESADDNDEGMEKEAPFREKRTGDLLTLMREIPRMLVLGEPGGGKTTTLLRFVSQCQAESPERPILAAFIPMGQWQNGGSLESMLSKCTRLTLEEWDSLLRDGRLRLVIDAVNECPDPFRPAAIRNLQAFLRDNPGLPVVISARTGDELRGLSLPVFTVQPMDAAHQLQYLTKYLNDPEWAGELLKRLQAVAGGQEIAANPMLLRLVVEVVRKEQTLPAGRADLYHKWLRQWHRRESQKAQRAGAALPWSFKDTLNLFADLAFQSRLQGYRDVPRATAEAILQRYGDDCLKKLCQGPVVIADAEYVRFRHETFQEYLCAEYLVAHPDALPGLTARDYAQWGMSIAYAAELCWPLPAPLWQAAWRLNPWFGLAVTNQQQMNDSIDSIISLIPQDQLAFFQRIFASDWKGGYVSGRKLYSNKTWYSPEDQRLIYLIVTKQEIYSRWLAIELWRVASCPTFRFLLFHCTHTIILKMNHLHFWAKDRFEQELLTLADKIHFPKSVFLRRYIKKWNCDISIDVAKQLINAGVATKEDFAKNAHRWIQATDLQGAIQLIHAGVATKEDFAERIPRWIMTVNSVQAIKLIEAGIATKEDFTEKVPKWIKNASSEMAIRLIQAGIATKEDFADSQIIVIGLINAGLATKEDFADRVSEWVRIANPGMAIRLIQAGLATKEDFAERIPRWIMTANSVQAIKLIEAGIATKEDFADSQIIVIGLINAGLATKEDFADSVSEWVRIANLGTAIKLIQAGLANKEDFTGRVSEWVGTANPEVAIKLIRAGFATKEDFAGRVPEWVRTVVNPEMKKQLIQAGLVAKKDFLAIPPAISELQIASKVSSSSANEVNTNESTQETTNSKPTLAGMTGLFANLEAVNATSRVLQQMQSANDAATYAKRCPPHWDMTFETCQKHLPEIKKAIALMQSISMQKRPLTNQNLQVAELQRLLASLSGLQPVLQGALAPAPGPGAACVISPKGDPKPMNAPRLLVRPEAKPHDSPKKPFGKPRSIKIVHGINYNPSMDFEQALEKGMGMTTFSQNADHIRIYIDEAWPGSQAKEYGGVGVISGIVWLGETMDANTLPWVPTHLRNGAAPNYQQAIERLVRCPRAFPFVFPIIALQERVTTSDYPELLRVALATLLGWVLPQQGCPCDVKIYCEGISSAQLSPGKNSASFLTEFFNGIALLTGRLQRWAISQFVILPTADKEFEYIPYADAVGYLTIPTQKAAYWGKPFAVQEWPGYVPLTKGLLSRLNRLDTASPVGYADELFDFARDYQKTKLFYYVLEQAVEKANAKQELREAILEKFETMFVDKQRDIHLLNFLCERLVKRFPLECFERYPRQKLLRLLIEIQVANHSGNPILAQGLAERYRQLRATLLADNRELCACADMNLAVHCNDCFDFAAAAATCRPWENDPSFDFLGTRGRGMILSSIGQSYAFAGDCQKAQDYFLRALNLFEPQAALADEADQTAIYRAHNLLDGKDDYRALEAAQSAFGCGLQESVDRYGPALLKPYHHHLLVKNLWFNSQVAPSCRDAYLAYQAEWQDEPQHPWELIGLYRALLLSRLNPQEAFQYAADLWQLFAQMNGGDTIRLIEAFARCAIYRQCQTFPDRVRFSALLDALPQRLPHAAERCAALRHAAADNLSDAEFWNILPFNYK